MRAIRKVLIANRGEIAVRVIRTCRERGIKTVAVYSDADRTMPHVLMADEAVRLGPAPSVESYLRMDKLIEAARSAGADAVHPGYGFLSENAAFAGLVEQAGLTFVGPPADAIRSMGDKTEARKLAQRAGVPIVPGTMDPVGTIQEALAFCGEAGYPILLKAAAGGGGKGMRVVSAEHELPSAYAAAESEARSAFGDGRVYLEKYIDGPRHVEVQILADQHGNVVHLGERECSVQRRHQKIIEETPSAIVDEALRREMGETAIRVARACGYVNAGTIEFLVDARRHYYFLEMNTRLQVEHPITELRTGTDLVALQFHIAAGGELPQRQEAIRFDGHAIECRICAEDPVSFMPDTGKITHLRPALGPGVREDRGIDVGNEISVYYDSMISKLIVWAPTRPEAIARMERALREYEILGVKTNIPLCLKVLGHRAFLSGEYTTNVLAEIAADSGAAESVQDGHRAAAVLCALLEESRPHPAILSRPGRNGTIRLEEQTGLRNGGWKKQRVLFW